MKILKLKLKLLNKLMSKLINGASHDHSFIINSSTIAVKMLTFSFVIRPAFPSFHNIP